MVKELEHVNRQLATSRLKATDLHHRFRTELARSSPTGLTEENAGKIDSLQNFIVNATAVNASLTGLIDDLRAASSVASTEAGSPAPARSRAVQRVVALTEMAAALLAKNVAWYVPPAIIRTGDVSFNDVGSMARLVVLRSTLAILAAAVSEYPLATDGQRRYTDAGGQLNQLQGFAQALDQVLALVVLLITNKVTGQDMPPMYQLAGYGLTAAGGTVQTGALNGLIFRVLKPVNGVLSSGSAQLVDDTFVPVDAYSLAAHPAGAAAEATHGVGRASPDLEHGLAGSQLNAWVDAVPATELDAMKGDLESALASVAKWRTAIIEHASDAAPGSRAATPPIDYEAHTERLRCDIGMITTAFGAFVRALPEDDERRVQIAQALAEAAHAERTIADLAGNATPRRTAFFASMALLSTIGSVLGAIGPSVHNAWLSDIKHRAAIFGVTSSVLQAFANLGQFLGGAKPGDGRLVRFLKIGLENDHNPYRAWTKNWLRSVRFLLGEFPLLQLSTTFSEMANKEAAASPAASTQSTPSAYTIRNVQETMRAVFSLAFTAFALGEEVNWYHYLGLCITALGAVVPTVIERTRAER
ncbi:hypothetical protein C6P77_23870 [Burkholderia ambifaria]|nr:hypothetical protein C6P77_23870 [Burkholderia ambifaria]